MKPFAKDINHKHNYNDRYQLKGDGLGTAFEYER